MDSWQSDKDMDLFSYKAAFAFSDADRELNFEAQRSGGLTPEKVRITRNNEIKRRATMKGDAASRAAAYELVYAEGKRACTKGKKIIENPYDVMKSPELFRAWKKGYMNRLSALDRAGK